MKIVVTSTGETLDSEVDARFGRTKKFILYDTESENFSVIDNEQNLELASGAGIQTANNIINAGAETVITPNCGPKAFKALNAAGIKIFICEEKKVNDVINDFIFGKLEEIKDPNVNGHWG
ncbi:NifB/NifX family molybdenum-iron cluster-binding protein [candidate division KSB1 bacterium]